MMRPISVRLAAGLVLAALLCAAPGGLAAKGRRGALIILAKVDGTKVRGELISVRPESLLLRRGGEALTIPRHKVHSVTILRRSRMASGALTGFTIGAALGIAWGISRGPDPEHGHPSVLAGAVCGGLGLFIGMAASRGEKVEAVILLAGLVGPAANERWNSLGVRSREGRLAVAARRP